MVLVSTPSQSVSSTDRKNCPAVCARAYRRANAGAPALGTAYHSIVPPPLRPLATGGGGPPSKSPAARPNCRAAMPSSGIIQEAINVSFLVSGRVQGDSTALDVADV